MILNRGKDSNSYGIRLTFSQADKTIFCFDMKELQWESYMDSSVLVRRVILILIIVAWFSQLHYLCSRIIFIGSSSVYPWRRRRQSRRGKRSVEKVVGNNHCFDGAIELVMEFICQTPFSSNFSRTLFKPSLHPHEFDPQALLGRDHCHSLCRALVPLADVSCNKHHLIDSSFACYKESDQKH